MREHVPLKQFKKHRFFNPVPSLNSKHNFQHGSHVQVHTDLILALQLRLYFFGKSKSKVVASGHTHGN